MDPRSRDRLLPELYKIVGPQDQEGAGKDRVRAAPAVSCAMCIKKNAAHEHTGSAETLRPSLRNGLTTYTRSPWRPGFLVTIAPEKLSLLRDLTPTLGRQDHTISSCARRHASRDVIRPSQPAPRFVTVDTPLLSAGDAPIKAVICTKN